ncbi:MAG: ABC transporter permease subunit [Thermoplasmata archaeon]|nr:ABC transporter permease subunit [Thermoplasmata archaeon]
MLHTRPLPRYLLALAFVPTVAGFVLLPGAAGVGADLPGALSDLGASFVRMLLAYLLSLGFALVYGYYAATRVSAERVMIPVLDILQSVPILGFFPLAIVVFVSAGGSFIGPNFACIFLIFTCMSWNMVFGVYESLKSIPADLKEAADSFGMTGWERMRRVVLPSTANRLVYNTVLSWTGGWYFLVAAEFISTSNNTTVLPGIGSFLLVAAGNHDGTALAAGLIVLIALIVLLDLFVWRPLTKWAEKFRYDTSPSGEALEAPMRGTLGGPGTFRRAAGSVARGVRHGIRRVGTPLVSLGSRVVPRTQPSESPSPWAAAPRMVGLGVILVFVWLLLIAISVGVIAVYSQPITPPVWAQMKLLPLALGYSFGRVVAAYALSVAIALPLAIWIAARPRATKFGLPMVEIVASVPATALFPLFIFALLPYFGFQGAAILMLITGMIWYLFFNILSGLKSIPSDLAEAARSYGLSRRERYRRLILPAIFPAFITGSITAFGGGWNTLVIAEYLQYGTGPTAQHFSVLGIGEMLNLALKFPGNTGLPLLVASLFALVAAVITVNELLWKRLYRQATAKYRMDY